MREEGWEEKEKVGVGEMRSRRRRRREDTQSFHRMKAKNLELEEKLELTSYKSNCFSKLNLLDDHNKN
jgi:hypothetical protein